MLRLLRRLQRSETAADSARSHCCVPVKKAKNCEQPGRCRRCNASTLADGYGEGRRHTVSTCLHRGSQQPLCVETMLLRVDQPCEPCVKQEACSAVGAGKLIAAKLPCYWKTRLAPMHASSLITLRRLPIPKHFGDLQGCAARVGRDLLLGQYMKNLLRAIHATNTQSVGQG